PTLVSAEIVVPTTTTNYTTWATSQTGLSHANPAVVARLAGEEFQSTPASTGWKTLDGGSQVLQQVTLALSGGDATSYQTLVAAMNAGQVEGVNYGKTHFTLNGNAIQYEVLTNYAGRGYTAWDFSTVASGVQVAGVTLSDGGDFDYRDATPGAISYNTWAESAGASHLHPARMTGGTFTDSEIVQVFGHSLYITGTGTKLEATKGERSFQIGGEGSSFDSLVDRVVISGGANLTTKGRLQVGWYGDGELLVTDSQLNLGNHLIVGDSRDTPGKGKGRAVFDHSTVTAPGTFTVGYFADAEVILQNGSSLTFDGGLNVVETNSFSTPLTGTLQIQDGSSLSVANQIYIGQATNSTGIVNLDNGTLTGRKTDGVATLGVASGAYGELNIGNGSTFNNTGRTLTLGNTNTSTGVMQVIGGENTIKTRTITINSTAGNVSSLNFLADNTGLSSIAATGAVSLNNKVNVGLAGGMVAMDSNTYTLISGATSLSGVPTENFGLWQLNSADNTLTATLNPDLELVNSPLNQGWIFLKDTSGADPSTISARLVLSGLLPGEIDNFVEWLNSEDYLGENADVTIDRILAAKDGDAENALLISNFLNEVGEAYFAFDFSGFDTNTLLQSITLTGQPEGVPEPGTYVLLLLGALWLIREKRRKI
ncbi:MAG: PEP-CTERM sorting domain-containing protein, partial [Planctomycetia bacterium]|nr:PEP-CTERM sorting domain-containing protein [Planctomycetia bacterium]